MPLLTPVGGEILVSGFTIAWGIFVETRYVSQWTIWFSIVPLIVVLTTLNLEFVMYAFLTLFLILSIIVVHLTGNYSQPLKQFVGAKAYGTITLAIGLVEAGLSPFGLLPTILYIGIFVGILFVVVLAVKWYRSS